MIKRVGELILSVSISIFVLYGLFVLLAQMTQASPALGNIIHVPGDYPTIQEAINASFPGDTILVASGTYTENIDYLSKDITVTSELGAVETIIDGGHSGSVVNIGPLGRLIGFTITNGYAMGGGAYVWGEGSIIENNIFQGNDQVGGYWGAAIAGNNSSPLIEENIFVNNSCDAQFLSGVVAFVNMSDPEILNNIFMDNPCRAINLTLPVGTNPKIINNTIINNTVGIRLYASVDTENQIYRNNIIVGNDFGLFVEYGSPQNNPTWEYNLVYGNGTNYEGIEDQTGLNGNISENPEFANELESDYHLRFGSPAIDSGSNDLCPEEDLEEIPRPLDGNQDWQAVCDMGAFEFAEPLADLFLSGPSMGSVYSNYTFTTTIVPITATIPITYEWQVSGQIPITNTGSISDTATFVWVVPGNQVINVIASSRLNTISSTTRITIIGQVFLPLVTLDR